VSSEAQLRRLSIEVEIGTDPITGRVGDPSGASVSFSGWLDLIDALERARNAKTGSGCDEDAQR
jgi:hypothetical protein